jgi:PAS domain S-box-containing protein
VKGNEKTSRRASDEIKTLRGRVKKLESERRKSATKLGCVRKERDFQRMLMEASPAYVVAVGTDGRIASMNDAMLNALGYTWDEVRGKDYATTVLPESACARFAETQEQIVKRGRSMRTQNSLLTKDGRELVVEWHGRPVRGDDGSVEYFFGIGIDITAHKEAEAALRSMRNEAQRYLDLAGVIFLSLARDGRITLINKQGCSVLCGSEEEMLGRDWFDTFLPEQGRQQVREVFTALMDGELEPEFGEHENAVITLTGEKKFIQWHNDLDFGPSGEIVGTISSGIDVTERRRAEDVQRVAYQIGSSIHTAESVQELFARIRQVLGGVMNTENFFIALYNREEDTLSLSYFVDEKDQDDFDSFPAGKTLTGYILKRDISMLVTREELDVMVEKGIVDMVGSPSLVWLGVPLRVKGEAIGALVLQSYTDRNEFDDADREMLEFVSEQIGFAIEHKRSEDELMTSEAKNRAILDAVPDMMFRLDRAGRFLSYDAPGDAPLAVDPELFLGKTIAEVFGPEFAAPVMERAERVFGTGEMQLLEYRLPVPAPSGDMRDFEARMVPSGDDAVLSVVRDITERKRAESLLTTLNDAALAMERTMTIDDIVRVTEERLAAIGMVGSIFLLDESGENWSMRYSSLPPDALRAAERLLGTSMMDTPLPLADTETLSRAVCERRAVYTGDVAEVLKQVLPLPKKKFAMKLQAVLGVRKGVYAPMIAEDRVFGIFAVDSDELSERDIPAVTAFANQLAAAWRKATLMKQLEQSLEELKETQDQLLQAQKMEAVGRLAGGVAHDFNNLLTAISGYAELMACNPSLDDQVQSDVEQIRKAADQAATLTRQLLAFSRRQPLQPVVVDINKVVVDMDAMLRRLIGEDIELTTALNENLCQTKADPGQLEQVIINLVVNARDAMPEGGKLTVSAKTVTLDRMACAAIHDARPGNFVCLSIEDTGSGIEREVLDQIFEPFFSTKGPGKGTGLGLAVVYGIIRQHEGWINVYSEPGNGTVFKVYLPMVALQDRGAESDGEADSDADVHGKGQRILLVEDEEAVRQLASRALTESGYVVFKAKDVEEAVEVFERENGAFDLVFTDVVLPDKSGVKLIEDLLERRPDLRVLVSSGYTDQKSQWPVIQELGFRFLQKPYSIVELLNVVDDLV